MRDIDRLPPAWPLLLIEPATWACALTGNQTGFGGLGGRGPGSWVDAQLLIYTGWAFPNIFKFKSPKANFTAP